MYVAFFHQRSLPLTFLQLFHILEEGLYCANERPFPDPDNVSKMRRSEQNASTVGVSSLQARIVRGIQLTLSQACLARAFMITILLALSIGTLTLIAIHLLG